jgi:hypothetical protein
VLRRNAIFAYTPHYGVQRLPTNPWIHQPFEDYDGMGIEGLRRNMRERAGS